LAEQFNPENCSELVCKLFSVMGQTSEGHATALIVANNDTDAEYYALSELGFISLSQTLLASDDVHVGPADMIR
jgi:hypothetical protein